MSEVVTYEYEKHAPVKVKWMPWLMCRYCGLVYLNNRLTKWSIRMGCNHSYHPAYEKTVKSMTSIKNKI